MELRPLAACRAAWNCVFSTFHITVGVGRADVKLQSGRPEIADCERKLDRTQRLLAGASADADDCLGAVKAGADEEIAVSQAAFARALDDIPIPLEARLDAAQTSGVAAAVARDEKLMSAPRDPQLQPKTIESERILGRPIIFELANLDPGWGPSVGVTIAWAYGDNKTTDAERLRRGEVLEHSYAQVVTVHPTVSVFDAAKLLGFGATEVFVRPSPATAAERLADIFLTTRFALALLIASVVFFWRFFAGSLVFGSSRYHYARALGLGFAAYAAVSDLPKVLAELPFK